MKLTLTGALAAALFSPRVFAHDDDRCKGDKALRLVNGRIHTMDSRDRVVSSVLIRNGRFAEVGHGGRGDDDCVQEINLRGRTAVPGIIDSTNAVDALANFDRYRAYDSPRALYHEGKIFNRIWINFLHMEADTNTPELRGTVEEGSFGDLIVLSDDYFDSRRVSDEEIKDIYSVLTVVNGKVVHDNLDGRKRMYWNRDSRRRHH